MRFPSFLFTAEYHWRLLVKHSSKNPRRGTLSSARCHTAWIGPPANIFLAADRLAFECKAQRRTPDQIEEAFRTVLIHEIAHAVEFHLMGEGFSRRQRWHSEGFASWFEALTKDGRKNQRYQALVLEAHNVLSADWHPAKFTGAKSDYARSFAMIAVIAERSSPRMLFRIYADMATFSVPFEQSVKRQLGWSEKTWLAHAREFVASEARRFDFRETTLRPMTLSEGDRCLANSERCDWNKTTFLPDLISLSKREMF